MQDVVMITHAGIAWYPWEDASSDFLLALHGPSTLALWNTATGDRIWNVLYVSQVCLFTLDPFDSAHLACELSRCGSCSDVLSEWHLVIEIEMLGCWEGGGVGEAERVLFAAFPLSSSTILKKV